MLENCMYKIARFFAFLHLFGVLLDVVVLLHNVCEASNQNWLKYEPLLENKLKTYVTVLPSSLNKFFVAF